MIRNLAALDSFDQGKHILFSSPAIIEKDLRTLTGILEGIACDNQIDTNEIEGVKQWMEDCAPRKHRSPYLQVFELLDDALEDGILTKEETENITWYCNNYNQNSGYYSILTAGIQQMLGIVKGIITDKIINADEIRYLDNWMEENDVLKNSWPYDELYNLTTKIINKKCILEKEHDALLTFCESIVGQNQNKSTSSLVDSLKTGYYQIDPDIRIPGHLFCLTGISRKYKRREIAEIIELYGGFVSNTVSAKVNYLLVCDDKNECWAFSCYGKKIEQAISHRQKGMPLVIVHENDFFDALENYK